MIVTLVSFMTFLGVPRANAQKLPQVRIALSTPTPHMAPLYVGRNKKFYEKYGLDVQLLLVNSGSLVAQMFAAGEAADDRQCAGLLDQLSCVRTKVELLSRTEQHLAVYHGDADEYSPGRGSQGQENWYRTVRWLFAYICIDCSGAFAPRSQAGSNRADPDRRRSRPYGCAGKQSHRCSHAAAGRNQDHGWQRLLSVAQYGSSQNSLPKYGSDGETRLCSGKR